MAALSESDAISGQIRTVALIAAASAIGRPQPVAHAAALSALHCVPAPLATRLTVHLPLAVCVDCRSAIFAVWLRDRLWPSRSTSRTTIGADRAARKWTEDDLDKVYLIAPSP